MLLLTLSLSSLTRAQARVDLPGTQPGELTMDLREPHLCRNCHGAYSDASAGDTWAGTMMANAGRDPLFQAALTIANQDLPGSGEICIRCHAPRAFLFGRADPPDLSAFEPGDEEGVTCDFCHRLTDDGTGAHLIGTGQYFVADDFVRRGPIRDPMAPHESLYDPYFESSEICGLCHDVSNPLRGGFAIERTYTEWLSSDYPAEGTTCQTCHEPATEGVPVAGSPGAPLRTLHRHEMAGGNTWMPGVLAAEHPELDRQESFDRAAANARDQLEHAATVSITAPASVRAGSDLTIGVRIENQTGHKLPTGYPEGRRCWLRLEVTDDTGAVVFVSGAYDTEAADRHDDPQLRTYEVRMAASGEEGFHFILQDELLQDNRIPPRGFVPQPDTMPVGRDYPLQPDGSLAHWDDAPYVVPVAGRTTGTLTVRATLLYQTTSRPYVELLRDANHTDDRGQRVFDLWERHGRAEPVEMASAEISLAVTKRPEGCSASAGTQDGMLDQAVLVPWVLWLVLKRLERRKRRVVR